MTINDTVRLTAAIVKRPRTLDVQHHDTARILDVLPEILGDGFVLDRPMAGSCYWLKTDLVRVRKARQVTAVVVPFRVSSEFVPSNFSPGQQAVIHEFEQALPIRRKRKRKLAELVTTMGELGIADCVAQCEVDKLQQVLPVNVNSKTHKVKLL